MSPTLADGDRLLVSYARRPVPGSIVVARFPDGTIVVKRAASTVGDRWWLLSDDPEVGVDSRHRGAIRADEVLGVAVARVWPRPRTLRVPRSSG
ncbi:hypothetical protein BH09ACT11_BH09ACT11_00620 [soil metagenome]